VATTSKALGIRLFVLAAAVVAVAAAAAQPAKAEGGDLALACEGPSAPVFLRWLDPFPYQLVPGGDFENGTPGWTLTGGARVVSGNEPFRVGGAGDSKSLYLPVGSSATTPAVCLGLLHPTLRLFATGPLLSTLKVEVEYRTLLGLKLRHELLPGAVGGLGWQPTLPLLALANVTGALQLDGETTTVQFRFSPRGLFAGNWRIDDVYVDPWMNR
jgi:hypothetical protein